MSGKSPDRHRVERSSRLIEAILDENTPSDLRGRMVQWFVSDMSRPEKYEALEQFMNDTLQPAEEYDDFVRQKFEELKLRIKAQEEETEILDPRVVPLRRLTPKRVAIRVAAVLIPFLIILSAIYVGTDMKPDSNPIAEITFEVGRDGQKDLFLSDSSRVWVNSDSKITFAEEFGHERRLTLEGEAFFAVQKDENRPFRVHTRTLDVIVLGTQFNVSAYPGSRTTEVTLFSGSVRVVAGERSEKLEPNSKLTYYNDSGEMVVETLEVTEDWRSENVDVIGKTLAEIFQLIENYYHITVEYDETTLGNELFNTAFGKNQTAADVIRVLTKSHGGITFREQEGTIIIEQQNDTDSDSRKP